MIYSNISLTAEEKKFDFGNIHTATITDEENREKKLLTFICPEDFKLEAGSLNRDFSIELTKSRSPRIVKKSDDDIYLLLSAYGSTLNRTDGTIQVLKTHSKDFKTLYTSYGGIYNETRWDCTIIKAPTGGIIGIHPSGLTTSELSVDLPSELYIIHENNVFHCSSEDLVICCDLLEIDLPCKISSDEGLLFDDWERLY